MARRYLPYLAPVILFISLIGCNIYPPLFWFGLVLSWLVCLWLFRLISRRQFFANWPLWLMLSLFLFSIFGQFAIIENLAWRIFYLLVASAAWVWLVYSLHAFFLDQRSFLAKQYMEFNNIFVCFGLWQVINFLYFALLFLNIWYFVAILLAAMMIVLCSWYIFNFTQLRKSKLSLVLIGLTLTTIELFIVIQLLPLHYYVQSALVTSWFYFIIQLTLQGQDVTSRRQLFWRYLLFFCFIAMLLFGITLLY